MIREGETQVSYYAEADKYTRLGSGTYVGKGTMPVIKAAKMGVNTSILIMHADGSIKEALPSEVIFHYEVRA